MLNNNFINELIDSVEKHEKINIFCHINPDYDTLGSGFGLMEFLKLNFPSKQINVVNTSKITNIHSTNLFKFDSNDTSDEQIKNSLGIIVDVASKERVLGGELLDYCSKVIIIDHHIFNEEIKNTNWIEPEYPACCQMIAEIIKYLNENMNYKINSIALTYLYAGLLTDTNRFLYECVQPSTYEITAWLVRHDAQKKLVHDELYIRNIKDAKRRAKFLNLVKINEQSVGSLFIGKKYNKKYKMRTFHDAISIMEGFGEIKIWVSCYYNQDYNTWNCSLRSRDYPVVEIATKYGGGGHKLAAGCRIKHPNEFKNLVKDLSDLIIKYGK